MPDDAKALSQHQFGAHAEGYVTSEVHSAGYSLDRALALAAPQPGMRALDLATGGGHTALGLARAGVWTVASDLTWPMLRAAQRHIAGQQVTGVCFVQLNAEHLPFPAEVFDVVTCRIAPHRFPAVAQFVRECARVVRVGGCVVVVDQLAPPDPKAARYINAFERLRDPSHVWAYNEAEWRGFFSGAGLEITHFEAFDTTCDLTPWAALMGCDAATITRLRAMLRHAPEPVAAWMKPALPGAADARFTLRMFVLAGRRARA